MKKTFLLIATAAFVFACCNNSSTEGNGCEKEKTECAKHHDGEDKICCKDGKPCEGKENCEKECDHKEKGCGEKKSCAEKKECEKKCEDKKEACKK
ncbi:MAG: hypothetical protein LBH22_06805 [Bacteroidales bacterium]|jgi:hypothetical protein|nr:hypothetical protein [Bacteroidales bacterium]